MANLIGKHLGGYQILDEIGSGGMAVVYKAYQPSLNRLVAIKVLREHLAQERQLVERFLREARAAAQLRHPNIIDIYDVGHEGGWYYIVMDYVEGGSLADRLRAKGALDVATALSIVRQIGSALDHAHGQVVVHRDVKPSNILLSDDGRAILSDFGIARAGAESRLTQTGTVVGTAEYMSPEQADGKSTDRRSDLYSLGVVLYEMLAGRPPFGGENKLAIMYKHLHESPLPPSRHNRAISRSVDQMILRALSKDRGKRYRTAGEMAESLARAIQQPGGDWTGVLRSWPVRVVILGIVGMIVVARVIPPRPGHGGHDSTPSPITATAAHTSILPPTSTSVPTKVPSSTPVRTVPSVAPSATAVPSSTPTRTRTPTMTATPSPTLSPSIPGLLQAPTLVLPLEGEGFIGSVTLSWQWVRPLDQDEHFDVRVWRQGEPAQGITWTEAMSYQVRGLDSGKYYWSILVLRHTGTLPDGNKAWEPVSEDSEVRTFNFQGTGNGPTPTRTPKTPNAHTGDTALQRQGRVWG